MYELLTDDERLGLLDGDTPLWHALREAATDGYNARPYEHGEVARLRIPRTRFVDGPRGCVSGHGTAFRWRWRVGRRGISSWRKRSVRRSAARCERRAATSSVACASTCCAIRRGVGRRRPYGDDPVHLGELGAALARGVGQYAMACVKHSALNSIENARFIVDLEVDEATLHDVYMPHLKRVIDEGSSAVTASYNSVNGEWMGQGHPMLTGVLRDLWQFTGMTATDAVWGMRNGAAALEAGMDLEELFSQTHATHLRNQLKAGKTSWETVERSGVRIQATRLRSYAARSEPPPWIELMARESHRALAGEVAAKAVVLLSNDLLDGQPVLPPTADVASIAVIGRLATAASMGDSAHPTSGHQKPCQRPRRHPRRLPRRNRHPRHVAIDVSLLALAEWDPDRRRRVAPSIGGISLHVGAHAHDPASIVIDRRDTNGNRPGGR